MVEVYEYVPWYRQVHSITSTEDDIVIARVLRAVSRYLDRLAGQWFGRTEELTLRKVRSTGTNRLRLDRDGAPGIATDEGMTVIVSGSATPLTVQLLPLNAAQDQRPFTSMELAAGLFPSGQIIEVTAIWGWPEGVPDLVQEVTSELAAIWLGQSPRASGRIGELDTVISASPMAMSLLKRFQSAYSQKRVA